MVEEVEVEVEGKVLVQGSWRDDEEDENVRRRKEVLYTDVPLSFWGGVDPETGVICDVTHPLYGECVSDCVLVMPSGRGSCTASQVLLELILNSKAPYAIVLQDVDAIVCTGVIIAQELFSSSSVPPIQTPTILVLSNPLDYQHLSTFPHMYLLPNSTTPTTPTHYTLSTHPNPNHDSFTSTNQYDDDDDGSTSSMELTVEEERVWKGEEESGSSSISKAEQLAMRIVVRLGNLLGAKRLIPVSRAHIDGCTYIGPGGLEFVQLLVKLGGKVKIPTTLNSISADRFQDLGLAHQQPARLVANAYLQLHCQPTFTCAPYLLLSDSHKDADTIQPGENIIWGESNAVVYANSVLGARTDKYADYFDICAALVGKVPQWGVHLSHNRVPTILIDISNILATVKKEQIMFPILGWLCGKHSHGQLPLIVGMEDYTNNNNNNIITPDDWKAFCAAFGTTGTSPLFHMSHQTPEAKCPATLQTWKQQINNKNNAQIILTRDDYIQALSSLDKLYHSTTPTKIHLIALGNPHLSITELQQLSQYITTTTTTTTNHHPSSSQNETSNHNNNNNNKHKNEIKNIHNSSSIKKHKDTRLIGTLSRQVYQEGIERGYIQPLKQFGMEFIHDTCWCMLTTPPIIPKSKDAVILTNSGKYAHYGPGLVNRPNFRFASTPQCIQAAITGTYSPNKLFSTSSIRHYVSNTHLSHLFIRFKSKFKL